MNLLRVWGEATDFWRHLGDVKNVKGKLVLAVTMLWFSPAVKPQVKQELIILGGYSTSLPPPEIQRRW